MSRAEILGCAPRGLVQGRLVKQTILIIEDDNSIREMVDTILSQAGYTVVNANSAEAGLTMLQRMQVDLVLLDIHMPNMSGLDALAVMKRIVKHVPPVLMLTADRSVTSVTLAADRGCAGYVTKPFTPNALVERVKRTLTTVSVPKVRRPADRCLASEPSVTIDI